MQSLCIFSEASDELTGDFEYSWANAFHFPCISWVLSEEKDDAKELSVGVVYSLSRNSSGLGGLGDRFRRVRICLMTSTIMLSGTGDQRLNWVAQKALP